MIGHRSRAGNAADPTPHRQTKAIMAAPTMDRTGERIARPHRTLLTAAAVCVIAASLAVVGWVHSGIRDALPDGRRYSVVEPSASSPQPLVPMLPAEPIPAGSSPPGPAGAISGFAGKCLHVPGNHALDGLPVEMTACDGSAGERWAMASDGTVRALGKCLEVLGDQTADGTRVQIAACRGGAGQQWRYTAGRDLVNPAADKCLDVKDFNAGDGAALQLWTCAGSANQKWSVPA
jgi:hypothetical protein